MIQALARPGGIGVHEAFRVVQGGNGFRPQDGSVM
jgi:hypothetical protein